MTLDELEALVAGRRWDCRDAGGRMAIEALPPLIAVARAAERHARHGPVTPTAAEARCAASSETRAELLDALAALR